MAQKVLSRKTGVIVGDDVLALFDFAQEKQFAIPSINVTSSSTVVAALEAARDKKSPVILQMSQGGGLYFAGKVCSTQTLTRFGTFFLPLLDLAFGSAIHRSYFT